MVAPLPSDDMEILAHGGMAMGDDTAAAAEELLNGGAHHDDTSKVFRQNLSRNGLSAGSSAHLPRDRLLDIIRRNEFKRPTPKSWTKTGLALT